MRDSLRSLIKTRLLLDRRSQSKSTLSKDSAAIKQLVEKNPELKYAMKEFASEVLDSSIRR